MKTPTLTPTPEESEQFVCAFHVSRPVALVAIQENNASQIPTHQLFNSRRRVRLSEVLAAIQSTQEG